MVAAKEESGIQDPPGPVKASWGQVSPLVRGISSSSSQSQNQFSFLNKAHRTFLKNQNSRAAISRIFGDPVVFWQDVLRVSKKHFICTQSYLTNSTWKRLWEIKPYTSYLIKQPRDVIYCHPNCSRERFPCHTSLSLHHILLSRSNAKFCLHR